ncbi:hypothetical protein Lepto7376_0744 [[Leptolyngbya] sp. PCC 7376]|uniref:DUF3153 domain-containing protein n=1 Tax=[Leptolyngbya] sp. PCC 7376 TaxID=111781 RepID=UPI00029F278B|nr:DUF3153 domain-containing protein [[Leptolyngbya] sp. PCC 7376]AFY37142.1 hypothetical protein Lepto7376_0744 [[Leptolyngbya] sp. PCC 7376]
MIAFKRKPVLRFLLTCLVCVFFLGGCVDYDVEIAFDHQHHGEIHQHLRLGDDFTNFNQQEARKWLRSVEKRAKTLHGSVKRISKQELDVKIPFHNGADMVDKFNRFFNPEGQNIQSDELDLVQLKSSLALAQRNWLLFEYNRATLDVDLRALGVLSQQGSLILSPGSLLDLDVSLKTPLWSNVVSSNDMDKAITRKEGDRLIWTLEPGQLNHLEMAFLVPSWVGLGAVAIVAFLFGGYFLKYKRLPVS